MAEADDTALAVDAQVNDPSVSTEGSEPSGTTEPTGTTVETAKPGTPDKALQKMQQELGNVTRELAALKEQKVTGELSEAQKAKLAKTEQRLEKIRQYANRFDREEMPSEVDPIADHVLDLTEKVGRQDGLESQLREANARLAALENDHNWRVAEAKYAGLDIKAIWTKAQTDADEVLGADSPTAAKNRLASKWFEERCDAAKKRQKESAEPQRTSGGTAPSLYRVGSGQKTAPVLSESEEMLAIARSLVVET